MNKFTKEFLAIYLCVTFALAGSISCYSQPLWDLAKKNNELLKISTIFMAREVSSYLSDSATFDNAISWCKQTGITKVYLESFRGGYWADSSLLVNARNRFVAEGFEVSGCVTTTGIAKRSIVGSKTAISCYVNKESQKMLQHIFEYTASIFDVIIIDDFLFTTCECEECIIARGDQTWSKFRCDLMVKMSRDRILNPAKKVNPDVKIIIKYPNWYDHFHERGYDVVRESEEYEYIYAGTETRDNLASLISVSYNAYFIMRWLGVIGGEKTLGGWFDALGTTPVTYREQARQTILANAQEMTLYCYGNLIHETNFFSGRYGTGVANIDAFRKELPQLFDLAKLVRGKTIKGIHMPKPPNSEPFEEKYVFSHLGMLGLPLMPADRIDKDVESAIFTVHALKQPGFSNTLRRMLDKEIPVVITDGLSERLTDQELLQNENLMVLKVEGDTKYFENITRDEIKTLRDKLLSPMGIKFDAPANVGLYLFGEDCVVIENFNDQNINATLGFSNVSVARQLLVLPGDGNTDLSVSNNTVLLNDVTPRTLVVVKYQ